MTPFLRELVRTRAGDRCEYCTIPQQVIPSVRFHIEHIIAIQHAGTDDPSNLALSCNRCNFHKGTNLSGIDPDTQRVVRLFNPRTDQWAEHFREMGGSIHGTTDMGRATARLLQMNSPERVQLRRSIKP